MKTRSPWTEHQHGPSGENLDISPTRIKMLTHPLRQDRPRPRTLCLGSHRRLHRPPPSPRLDALGTYNHPLPYTTTIPHRKASKCSHPPSPQLFLLSNIGLALSPSIPVLTALRFFQAAGCSSTISIGAGVIADIAPASERGGFTGTFAGVRQVSVAIGPVIGGIVAGTLGFRAVFWFLAICAGVVVALVAAFLAETLRYVAGDGSFALEGLRYAPLWRRAAPWRVAAKRQGQGRKRSRTNSLQRRGGIRREREVTVDSAASSRRNSGDFLVRHNEAGDVEMMPPPYYAPSSYAGSSRRGSDSDSSERTLQVKVHPATPQRQQPEGPKKITWKIFFEPAKFLLEKDVGCTLFFGAIVYTVFSMVTSSTTFLLADYYGLDTLQ